MTQWLRYVRLIDNPDIYPGGALPSDEDRAQRRDVLDTAFDGLVNTTLAVYEIPAAYELGDICEIFETLNTTGTRVSTVDLVHSWLYSETFADRVILLREWIADLGDTPGAVGWASTEDRPELVLQIATACYVAMDTKPAPPRQVGRRSGEVTSIKAGDMLAVPTEHWREVVEKREVLAGFIHDFQHAVASGKFGWRQCPYPATASIYVALRWHRYLENAGGWSQAELDLLFGAFFWRNALATRYDQGFLTQLGADLKLLKSLLEKRQQFASTSEWIDVVDPLLSGHIGETPSRESLVGHITDGRTLGALKKALLLPMVAGARTDLFSTEELGDSAELHHIYPRDWCRNNTVGELAAVLRQQPGLPDWVNATANLMPLSRDSNRRWKARSPGQMLREDSQIEFDNLENLLSKVFIDQTAFDLLAGATPRPEEFWSHRSDLIADHLMRLMTLSA